MSGLEKIILSITGEAKEQSEAIIKEAEEEAAAFLSDSKKRADEEAERISQKSRTEVEGIRSRAKASAELKGKQILLSGKQELIAETLENARAYVGKLSDPVYVKLIRAIFNKHVPEKDAVISFNEKDQKRIPANIIASFVQEAKERGAVLTVSVKPADIRDGFILDFGGIEENCSIDALIDENIEEIGDMINKNLFL